MGLVTQAEYARIHNFSKAYISKLIKKGKLQLVDGRIDEELADEILCLSDRAAKIDDDSENTQDLHKRYLKARLKSEENRARILELEREEKEKNLIPSELIKKDAYEQARIVREKLLAIPDRVATLILGLSTAAEIHEVLSKEIRQALEELANV